MNCVGFVQHRVQHLVQRLVAACVLLLVGMATHGIAQDLIDREGNSLHPIFSTDEQADYCCCECVRRFLDRRGNTDPEND